MLFNNQVMYTIFHGYFAEKYSIILKSKSFDTLLIKMVREKKLNKSQEFKQTTSQMSKIIFFLDKL